ncbi:DNA-directed RNA polymerase subunit beta' [Candidatus Kaiserbacteria bacterium RIFCSPLOWO2_02_FULL_54_13]|uniref:DNA-directed RNA polymerase subunit beta' n=2 Tax=Parcubacteria group TaxID=1794811 RepID=A0A1F6DKY2_9BACT|nr:MAG: DNA-directed RNA polymerase subunit beta' [Parcubacteria group bacterium GW2011_GWB1_55_9]OGG62089.1 MAG: DNA-directed RNA polymerase subunit beta' [Candidatus Kaiserbacteria bacterium RIFCSPHIGHO2_02_FULL_54_22]OGG68964.1 MAG: DNA-directed RNA polymerase subunit beta' [Candidatus Kaiserbacteria bacterium RIFCSPHIGHO2_12_FULL_54_16]OGG82485.1 MAG: DNA-directed RNA polymerase subunit beta' [Candidatus Kaiserbacteria bacterium RIFCSPLOWO2_02_FULL_54_13]
MAFTPRKLLPRDTWNGLRLTLASPERILAWSSGEVTKPETINYRTQRSEKHGLFDEKIFGPEKDYECYCGKYKGIRYKGIVCDKCGVEITRSIVRRERMGHIELCTPVAHIWFLRSVPSRMALILGASATDIEKVVYFAGYIVTKIAEEEKKRLLTELESEYKSKYKSLGKDSERDALKEKMTLTKAEIEGVVVGKILDELEYHRFSVRYGGLFEARIGAEAIYDIFRAIDLKELEKTLSARYGHAGAAEREKLAKRLSLIAGLIASRIRPEWLFLTRIPVIPPALRPMVALEGGRHATSDVNDLYRRVINRNNRLKKLIDIHAPEVILRNEKRILQEAVDALLDNSIRKSGAGAGAMTLAQRRPLKSLADYLKGKQGYFRQNLLGKRVDYSGRSVIVVGPDLELDECGLPKHMALELFRPFVIAGLLERELAFNIRGAGRLIEDGVPEVWEILEEAIKGKYVLLNRAPTLHRQGIQAFRPRLIEGDAIQLHPLVCNAFNADFDGDQMAVHVPLSEEAQWEAQHIMSANKNILKPGNGEMTVLAAKPQDIILGLYWLTKAVEKMKGEGEHFASPNAAILASEYGAIDIRAAIKVLPVEGKEKYAMFDGHPFETTVGQLLFNTVLPADYPFVKDTITKKALARIMTDCAMRYGFDAVPNIVNKVKRFGFQYATKSGVSWCIDDVSVSKGKPEIIARAAEKVAKIDADYQSGLLSEEEKRRMNIEVWQGAKQEVEQLVTKELDPTGSVSDMVRSGARGTMGNLTQMAGMKGLIQNTAGETIEVPIISSMIEGLNPVEYFMSTHGARKGLTDTALGTAKAGYLTRRLFDVAQDSIVTEKDCGTKRGVKINRVSASGIQINYAKALLGRVLAEDVSAESGSASGGKDAESTVLFKAKHYLSAADAEAVDAATSVTSVVSRSPMSCETRYGICQTCYGMDLTTQELVDLGEAVGTVAAQAIGEPGTQLTMRTFHTGGVASVGGDITSGLPRVEEVFEKRSPKNPAVISKTDGIISEIKEEGREKVIVVAPTAGQGKKDGSAYEYLAPYPRVPLVKVGDTVVKGQILTDGSADLDDLFEYAGRAAVQEYIITEASKIYELQGASVSRKHLEVVVKQMFSRVKITDAGDTDYSVGDVVEDWEIVKSVKEMEEANKLAPKSREIVLGIKESALSRRSFLSAASFEQTTKILINAALRGSVDRLRGLKENVILGRLIPSGTGFKGSKKFAHIAKLQAERPATASYESRTTSFAPRTPRAL